VLNALRRLFAGGGEKPAAAEAVEYKGYSIIPQPRSQGGGYLTAGVIMRETAAGRREHNFVRADTHPSLDEARQFTVLKAQRLIDEQGEALFRDVPS
jgi:hypothetical protein